MSSIQAQALAPSSLFLYSLVLTIRLLGGIRSIDFGVTLLGKLEKDPNLCLEQGVGEAYEDKLKPWHGWISSAAYKVLSHSIITAFLIWMVGWEQKISIIQ